ncbi:MAG TPA: redoxin domain-containing protein [Chloroflexota bacterium]
MAGNLEVGSRAPDFSIPQTRYEKVSLKETLGKGKVVLLFYFMDFSGP